MYSHILVPLDGSNASERALSHAQSLALAFGATIHLLQVVSRSEEFDMVHGQDSVQLAEISRDLAQEIVTAHLNQARQYLDQTASRLKGEGLPVETTVLEGAASENIVDYARENNIDLIVMGTRGRGGLGRFLLGSVTDRVIRSGHVPVLAVPSE